MEESKSNISKSIDNTNSQRLVGLVYDERMCKHHTPDGDYHPEQPNRIKAIWDKLQAAGILQRCVVLDPKEAEDKHLMSVHSKNHVNLIKNISSKQFDSRRERIASQFNSIYFNEGSSEAASLAAGSVIEVVEKVASGELNSGVAIVRPPGHHAEQDKAMGFCLFNNVAVATKFLLDGKPGLGVKKILIVDWDVHHGNGTQKMFWKDSCVLFFSVHRHEFGSFYPANDDGFYTMVGEGQGAGYNINVPWENGQCGDADYFAVWDHLLVPVTKEFNPDIIIVSAGFDAAAGDPLGGCRITPYGYSVLLKKLMDFAQGKIVLVLEGGYKLDSIANSMLACVEVLLEDKPIVGSLEAYPFESTWRVIQAVRQELSPFWPTLAYKLPEKLISQKGPPPTQDDKDPCDSENLVDVLQGVIEPLSKLKVDADSCDQETVASNSWRSELSKIYIWYASFGSNMWKSRFLCYIRGGQVEGMQKQCCGSMDRNPPKEILWKTFPYRLFFGRDYSRSRGPGGVAFIKPERNSHDNTYMRLYKISLEQFNDVLFQENGLGLNVDSPLFNLSVLNAAKRNDFTCQEVIKGSWYGNIMYLGMEQNIPIVTMSCSLSDIQGFKSGKLTLCSPSKAYANTLIKGLVQGKQLTEMGAIAYIEAADRPL